MRIPTFLFAAAATLAGTAANAEQSCQPEFPQSSQTVTVSGVEIAAGASTTENFQIRVRNEGSGQCGATLRAARLSTSVSTGAEFVLRFGGSILEILPTENSPGSANSDVYISGISGGSNGRALPLFLTVPSDWGLSSGVKEEELLLSLIGADGSVLDTMILRIVINVPPSVELRIVGVTGNNEIAGINLGALAPDTTTFSDPFGVRIWSTSPYSVTFESDNNGNLRHQSLTDTISYRLRMDGALVDLEGNQPVRFGTRTDSLGDLHRLDVSVPPFTARAGDYSDRVLVTVTAG